MTLDTTTRRHQLIDPNRDREARVQLAARSLQTANKLEAPLTPQERTDLLALVDKVRDTVVRQTLYYGVQVLQ